MEIGTMSAEELAKSFSGSQNQNQPQNQPPVQNPPSQQTIIQEFVKPTTVLTEKSAEELAKEFEEGKQKPAENSGEQKTPEQIAAEKEAVEKAEGEKNKGGRPKTKLDDSFKQGLDKLFKEQKLNPYSDGTETGYVIPETFEDVLDLIEDNKKSWIEQAKSVEKEELINEILATKSPAWQFLIQNADLYKDPAELVPLLTAVQNQQYSDSLDVSQEEDQEKIVRASLSIQGLPPQTIEDEIADLKERGKLGTRAEVLKPVLDKFNQEQTAQVLRQKEEEQLKTQEFWNTHFQNLEETVFKSKDIDGAKLKNEHKQLIAAALIPDERIEGLPIYAMIDNLLASGDFKRLSKIVLLANDEKLFDSYFLTKKAEKAAEGVQRVLRQSGVTSNATELDDNQPKVNPIRRSSYGYFG